MKATPVEKKHAAKQLFMEGNEQRFIAQVLGISEKTLSTWATTEGWAMKRASRSAAHENINDDVLFMISRLAAEKRKLLENADAETIQSMDGKFADAIHKLWSIVKDKQTPIHVLTSNITELLKYVQAHDPELAKKLVPYTKDFLEAKRTQE